MPFPERCAYQEHFIYLVNHHTLRWFDRGELPSTDIRVLRRREPGR